MMRQHKVSESKRWLVPIWLLLVADLALMGGCGTVTSSRITHMRAMTYAHAVNLRAADVGGMTSFAAEFPIRRSIFGPDIERCGGVVGIGPVFSVNSPRFRVIRSEYPLESEAVRSSVYFTRSSAIARQDVAAMSSTRFRACVERYEEIGTISRPKVRGEAFKQGIKVSVLPTPSSKIQTFGWRMSGRLAAWYAHSKTRRPFFEDVAGFAVGPAVIILRAEGTPRPPSLVIEGRLLRMLETRAQRHEL